MLTKSHSTGRFSNFDAVALQRWEDEGGAVWALGSEQRESQMQLSAQDVHILQCLGAAVLSRWAGLPTHIQHQLFEHSFDASYRDASQLRGRIARFLHKHKDDAGGAQ
jgi:hypothetical protein